MTTQDKEAVEAAEKHADQIVGPPPYDLQKWKHRKLGFLAGVEWQRDRKPKLGEDHED
jgi:hypothetical protein